MTSNTHSHTGIEGGWYWSRWSNELSGVWESDDSESWTWISSVSWKNIIYTTLFHSVLFLQKFPIHSVTEKKRCTTMPNSWNFWGEKLARKGGWSSLCNASATHAQPRVRVWLWGRGKDDIKRISKSRTWESNHGGSQEIEENRPFH